MGAPLPGWALPTALAEVALPLALGWALGRWAPRGAAAAAAALLVGLDVLVLRRPLGDVVLVAVLVLVGALVAARVPTRRLPVLGLGVGLGLAVAEGVGRALLPAVTLAPVWVAPWEAVGERYPNVLGGTHADEHLACALAYEEPAAHTGPGVLHLGDSVVHGSGVSPTETFVAALDAAPDGRAHVVRAAPGVAPDVLLLAARRALATGRWEAAVLYVFAGNDLAELDFPYLCCPGGGLLDDTLQPRCPTPRWPGPTAELLAASPPPLALRVGAEHSRVGAHLAARWAGWRGRGQHWFADVAAGRERALGRLASIVGRFGAEATAVGARPVVVVIPDRAQASAPERYADVLRAAGATGLEVVDAGAWVSAADDAAYVDPIHLSVEGHRAFATWLSPRLLAGEAP